MTLEEALSFVPTESFVPPVKFVQTFEELKKEDLDISGDNEIGYYKEVSENCYILSNDRVDSMVYIVGRPDIYAVKIIHYHRRGQMYSVIVYN